jgi:hypothetical protein
MYRLVTVEMLNETSGTGGGGSSLPSTTTADQILVSTGNSANPVEWTNDIKVDTITNTSNNTEIDITCTTLNVNVNGNIKQGNTNFGSIAPTCSQNYSTNKTPTDPDRFLLVNKKYVDNQIQDPKVPTLSEVMTVNNTANQVGDDLDMITKNIIHCANITGSSPTLSGDTNVTIKSNEIYLKNENGIYVGSSNNYNHGIPGQMIVSNGTSGPATWKDAIIVSTIDNIGTTGIKIESIQHDIDIVADYNISIESKNGTITQTYTDFYNGGNGKYSLPPICADIPNYDTNGDSDPSYNFYVMNYSSVSDAFSRFTQDSSKIGLPQVMVEDNKAGRDLLMLDYYIECNTIKNAITGVSGVTGMNINCSAGLDITVTNKPFFINCNQGLAFNNSIGSNRDLLTSSGSANPSWKSVVEVLASILSTEDVDISCNSFSVYTIDNITLESSNTAEIKTNQNLGLTAGANITIYSGNNIVISCPDGELTFVTNQYTPTCTDADVDTGNTDSLINLKYLSTVINKQTLSQTMTVPGVTNSNQVGDNLNMNEQDILNCSAISYSDNSGEINYINDLTFTSDNSHPPKCTHTPTDNTHLVNLGYLTNNYIPLSSSIDMSNNSITNCTTLECTTITGCTSISYPNSILFIPTDGSTAPPSCDQSPYTSSHLVNLQYLTDYLSANYTPLPSPSPSLFSINENLPYSEGNSIYIPNNCINGYTAFGTDENSVVYLPETVTGGNHIWVINQHSSMLTVETQGTTQIWNNGTISSTITKEGFGTLHFIGLNDNWIYVN